MKKLFSFRFEEKKVKDWKVQGKKENRNLTNFIETVITNYVNENKIKK